MKDTKGDIKGIHHITAITGDPQENIDFYTNTLGLRMVKLTVNFDDPSAYHLYLGDELGRPGTALTFFSWPGARKGSRGAGQATSLSFSIPANSIDHWTGRLMSQGISIIDQGRRFEEEYISFLDPDGLLLELTAHDSPAVSKAWEKGPVPVEHAIRGFHSVTLNVKSHDASARFLTAIMGFRAIGESGDLHRYESGPGGSGSYVDIRKDADGQHGIVATGTIHHVAFRTPDEQEHAEWRNVLMQKEMNVTQVVDRYYFKSIYFREPGGVLFEIATDGPGFTADEAPEKLGSGLRLPPWMEQNRALIERGLPPIESRKVFRS